MKTQMRNIHTGDVVEVELIETIKTWQTVYKVRFNGVLETITSAQGWMIVK